MRKETKPDTKRRVFVDQEYFANQICYSKYNFCTFTVNTFSIFSLFNNNGAFDIIKFGTGNQDIHSIPKRNVITAYDFKFICDNPTRLTETSSSSPDHFLFQNSEGKGVVFQQKFSGEHTPVQLKFKTHNQRQIMKKCIEIPNS